MTKDATTKGTSSKDVGAVVNAIQILRHLAHADGPQGVAAIARATGISPSSAFNILRTLSNERLTSFDDAGKTYQLGLGLSELAVGFVGRSYADLIQPELERLSLAHHILIALWQVTDDAHIRVIALAAPPGWAIDQEHLYRGVSMVASAITDRDGQPRFAISAIGISAQHQPDDLERIGTSLRDTARFVSRALFPQGEALKEKS